MAEKLVAKLIRSTTSNPISERVLFLTRAKRAFGISNEKKLQRDSACCLRPRSKKLISRNSFLAPPADRRYEQSKSVCYVPASASRNQRIHYHSFALDDFDGVRAFEDKGNNLTKQAAAMTKNIKEKLFAVMNQKVVESPTSCDSTARSYKCIPGPRRVPFLGSALEYTVFGKFSPKEYDKALKHRHLKYGSIFREKIMDQEYVYISDPNDIRLLVQNEGKAPNRPRLDAIVESRKQEKLPLGITAMQGEEWLRNRNAINPAISLPREVKKFGDAQRKVAADLVTFVKTAQDPKTREVPQFDQVLIRWALESVAVALLDTRLGLLKPGFQQSNTPAEGLRRCMDVFFDYGASLTFGLPIWKIWKTKEWKIFCNSQKEEFKYAGYFVEKKLKELKSKSRVNVTSDFEGDVTSDFTPSKCPMHQQMKGKKGERSSARFTCLLDHVINNSDLSKEEAVTVCLEMLAGGIDTTSTAAVFTFYQLAVNPHCQDQLISLLKEEEGKNSATGCYDREKSEFSKYLKACIWESMRLNPLTYANMRTTEKDLVFSGYSVPAGTVVRYTSHLMNLQSEDFFLDAKRFIPERWMDRNSPYRCSKQFTFTPFGHGARQCPGRRLAEQELDLLFREILSNFRIGYKYEKIGTKVRLFNGADKPAKFDFTPIEQ